MDLERIGEAVGMRRTMDAMGRDMDNAVAQANATISTLNAKVLEARRQAAEAQAALAIETAFAAGLQAQVKALRAELAKAQPAHELFKLTGRKYDGGLAQTHLALVYENAFDGTLKPKGIDGKKHRQVAK